MFPSKPWCFTPGCSSLLFNFGMRKAEWYLFHTSLAREYRKMSFNEYAAMGFCESCMLGYMQQPAIKSAMESYESARRMGSDAFRKYVFGLAKNSEDRLWFSLCWDPEMFRHSTTATGMTRSTARPAAAADGEGYGW